MRGSCKILQTCNLHLCKPDGKVKTTQDLFYRRERGARGENRDVRKQKVYALRSLRALR